MLEITSDERVPGLLVDRLDADGWILMDGAAALLCRPCPEQGCDVAQRSEPVERGRRRRGVREAGPLVVSECDQGFDMFVVSPPAGGQNVVVDVGEPLTQLIDPRPQLLPGSRYVIWADCRPARRTGDLVEHVVVDDAEQLAE